MKYLHEAIESPRVTPQSDPIPGSTQILNNAGGYGWDAGIWARLDRFLILGSEGGSYYARQRDLTTQNIDNLKACIVEDGERMVARIVEISETGRAPKNDPALFALAHAASYKESLATRRKALDALPRVARTGTHLLHFAAFIDKLRGWGPAVRRAFEHRGIRRSGSRDYCGLYRRSFRWSTGGRMSRCSASGNGFYGGLTILFIGLKLTGFIQWSWWWVLSPTLIVAALFLVAIACLLVEFNQAEKNRRKFWQGRGLERKR